MGFYIRLFEAFCRDTHSVSHTYGIKSNSKEHMAWVAGIGAARYHQNVAGPEIQHVPVLFGMTIRPFADLYGAEPAFPWAGQGRLAGLIEVKQMF